MSTTRLPVEIWDVALDHLWDDTFSLKACALTCRTWLQAARYHLFHTFEFCSHIVRPLDEELDVLLVSGSTSRIGSMAGYVRCLNILIEDDGEGKTRREPETFRHFTKVTEVTLRLNAFRDRRPENIIVLLKVLTNVKTLTIRDLSLGDPSFFAKLIPGAFPAVSKLTLYRAVYRSESENIVASVQDHPHSQCITHVVLDTLPLYRRPTIIPSVLPLLGPPWFSSYPPRLELLLYGRAIGHRGDETKVNEIFRAAGASLKHLELTIREPTSFARLGIRYIVTADHDPDLLQLSLLHNTGLVTLTLSVAETFKAYLPVTSAWFLALLSRIGSTVVERVMIRLGHPNASSLLNWSEIGVALRGLLRSKKEVIVQIVFKCPSKDKAVAEATRLTLENQVQGVHAASDRLQVLLDRM